MSRPYFTRHEQAVKPRIGAEPKKEMPETTNGRSQPPSFSPVLSQSVCLSESEQIANQNSNPSSRPPGVSSWSVSRMCSGFTISGGGEVVVIMYWKAGSWSGNRASREST